MNGFSLLIWAALTQMPSVQVTTLAGDQYQGPMESFQAESVILKSDAKTVSIPIGDLLLIRSLAAPSSPVNGTSIEIRLIDNSRLRVKSIVASGSTATVNHMQLGELKLSTSIVSSVRLAPADSNVDSQWTQLIERTIKKDLVAVRKGDVLDHLDGVIGSLSETTLQFQLDGDDIPIKRERVFGLIFSKRESTAKKAIAQLELVTGDLLAVKQIGWNGTIWKLKTVSGLDLDVTAEMFQSLDYSLGKFTYLSDIEPRSVKHVPFFDIQSSFAVNEYRRDRNFDGGPISLNKKIYPKGLAIHSQTLLKYRLGGEYRRFQAIMGIGDEVPNGDVDVVFKGDNKPLFKTSVKAITAGDNGTVQRTLPLPLDLDVTGVVEFEIFVDFGSDMRDIGDRLYLANARAVK
jgi:hypothetical protein